MVLDPIHQSLPVHFFGSRPQPPTSQTYRWNRKDGERAREHKTARTATHCQTLPQTGPHCNTLRHTAPHCDTLQHSIFTVWITNVMDVPVRRRQHIPQRTATHCNTLQHTATHCNTLQHSATHNDTQRHTATQYKKIQNCKNGLRVLSLFS